MKNETNTQHTPAPWHVTLTGHIASQKGNIVAFTGGEVANSMGSKSLLHPDERSANAKLIARAPELLKENEQLNDCFVVGDEGVNPVARFYGNKTERKVNAVKFMRADDDARENIQLKALNAELLEALKWTMIFVRDLRYDEQKEKKEQILNLIAKAEGKTLVGS